MAIYYWKYSQEPSSILFYYPLKNDLNDYSGNGYNLTASGSDYSFTTNSEGIGCVNLNASGTSTHFYMSSGYPTINMNNKSFTLGFYICDSYAGSSSGSYCGAILSLSSTYKMGVSQSSGDYGTVAYSEHCSSSGTKVSDVRTSVTGNKFSRVIYIYDSTNGTFKCYVNGEIITEYTGQSGYRTNQNQFIVGRDTYDNNGARWVKAKICNVIGSEYIRGDDEISWFNGLN